MYHGKNNLRSSTKNTTRQSRATQVFLDIVKAALERCEGVCLAGLVEDEDRMDDISLVIDPCSDDCMEIGYARDGMYFLDSEFIYDCFRYFDSHKTQAKRLQYDKQSLYAELLQTGILLPSRWGKTNPLHMVDFSPELDGSKYVECICVSGLYVDFDLDTMEVH